MPPSLAGTGRIRLQEGLAQGGRDHGVLGLGDSRQGVSHPVDPASLPRGAQRLGDRGLEAFMGVGDDQFYAAKPTTKKAFEEKRPERLGFAGSDVQPHDFSTAFRVHSHGDYSGDADHPATFTLLEVGRVQPQIGPFPGQRPGKEGMEPFIDVLAQLGHLGLGDPGKAHGLDEIIHAPGGDAADPGFLDDGHQSPFAGLARLQEGRKVAALAQFGMRSCKEPTRVSKLRSR